MDTDIDMVMVGHYALHMKRQKMMSSFLNKKRNREKKVFRVLYLSLYHAEEKARCFVNRVLDVS
jgi:hypothetical protein